MAPTTTTTSLVFSPGPLGLELEPVWEADGRAVGCCVAGFRKSPDGNVGQAERVGARPGDVLAEIGGVLVRDMSFEKIIALLRQDTDRPERHLTFQSSSLLAAAGGAAPAPAMPISPKTPGRQASSASAESYGNMSHPRSNNTTTSTAGSTQPTTPSPGSNKLRSAGESNKMFPVNFPEESVANFTGKGGEKQQKDRRLGWAMGLLGMGGVRAGDAGAPTMVDGSRASVVVAGGGGSGVGACENGDSAWCRGAQQVELEESQGGGDATDDDDDDDDNDDDAARAFSGAKYSGSRVKREERYLSQGVAQLFLEGAPQTIDGHQSASNVGGAQVSASRASSMAKGDCDEDKNEHDPAAAPAVAGGSSISEEMAKNEGRQLTVDSINISTTVIHAAAVTPGGYSGAPSANEEVAWPHKSPQKLACSSGTSGVHPSLVSGERHHQPLRHASEVLSSKAHGTTLPALSLSPFANRVSTRTTVLDEGEPERAHARGRGNIYDGDGGRIRGGSPETVGKSLDTVSLLSEPAGHTPSKQRVSMFANLWGGGGGGQVGAAGAGAGAGTCAASPVLGNEEDEVEVARRLARSLAVKLKERARRCDELEDLFGLRDHQVSMLQRQSNALAVRAASLEDNLSDKSALVEALQQDRVRLELELELAQARFQSPQDEKDDARGHGNCSGHRSAEGSSAGASTGEGVISSSLPRLESSGVGTADEAAAAMEAAAAAGTLSAAVEAAERKAGAAVVAAEARCFALTEMVDSLVAEKVKWEEERASGAAEALRLRALVRGLEEATVARGVGDEGDGGGAGGSTQALLVVKGLRKLLRERTRELEVKSVEMERLAAHARELDREKQRLVVSLSAREEDILVSDRQMQALSMRLKGEARASGEAAAGAEAVAEELRRALEDVTATADDGKAGGKAGDPTEGGEGVVDSPPVGDRVEWAEERACLNHNLVSLRQALQDREAQAEADEAATSSRLKASQNDFDRSARERVSPAKAIDSLRVELAEALLLAAATRRGSVSGGRDEVRERHQVRERQAVSGSVMVSRDGDVPVEEDGVGGHDEVGRPDGGARRGEPARTGVQEPEPEPDTGEESEQGADVCGRSEVTAEGQGEEAAQAGSDHRVVSTGGGGAAAVVMRTRDRWLDGGFEGAIDNVQLDLMEKDIVIEQLRNEVKQLRSRIAMMEEDQAADTAPLQGLLNQLGELKGSVEERENREQRCRDQVDLGLMRMERLKEENAAATGTTAVAAATARSPDSSAGPAVVSPPVLPQADPFRDQAQVEQQRLRRQLEDSQWDLRALKRRVDERDNQLRDVRSEVDSLMKRVRVAERDLGAAQSELAIAAAEVGAERRRSSVLRAELQSVRAELQSVRERVTSAAAAAAAAKSSAEEQRQRIEADGRDRVSVAVAAQAGAEGRAATLSASLRAVTVERDELLAAKATAAAAVEAAARRSVEPKVAEGGISRTRELEFMRCALAARDVELESIVDATAGFRHHADSQGVGGVGSAGRSGGSALRGALAAATEARRAGRLVAELQEESLSLKAKAKEERADASRLRVALEQAKLAEQQAAAAADAANAASGTAATGRSSSDPSQNTDVDSKKGGFSPAEAQAADKRVQEAEDALQKALTGARQAWGVVSSCLADESRMDDSDLFGATITTSSTAAAAAPSTLSPTIASLLLKHQPASLADPSLGNLVSVVEALSAAYRNRGHAIRRATVNARAKYVCAREARRREEAERRAREGAEERLEEALVALDDCRRHHQDKQDHYHHQQQQQQRQQQQQPVQWGFVPAGGRVAGVADPGGGVPGDGDGARPFLSQEQEEHLRQIRGEVDRLEDQNRTLRRSLEGAEAGDRLLGKTTETRGRGKERVTGGNGTSYGRKRSDSHTDCWELAGGLSGSSGQVRTPSPSPVRSWAAVSNGHGGGAWPPRGGIGGDDSNGGQEWRGGDDGARGEEDDDAGNARARVLEECAGCCAPPQDDGSGGTLVPGWGRDT